MFFHLHSCKIARNLHEIRYFAMKREDKMKNHRTELEVPIPRYGYYPILLMAEILHQLILIGSFSHYIFIGFHTSQVVVWDFSHQQYYPIPSMCYHGTFLMTNISPGIASKITSIGAWTSPHASTALCGVWQRSIAYQSKV